jgi:PAS domain S-box-containing protein
VITTDNKGLVLSSNDAAVKMTGWKEVECLGKPIEDIFDAINESTKDSIPNPIYDALTNNKITLLANHTILVKKDQTERIIVDSAMPVHNEKSEVVGAALIFKDVTAEYGSRKKLVETEGLLQGILDNTTLVIYVKDLDGNYLLINKQKEKIYGIKAEALLGQKSVVHLSAKDAQESRRTDLLVQKSGTLCEYDHVIHHADGVAHSYHTSKFPLYDNDHKVYAICAISTNISESKRNIEFKEKSAVQDVINESKNQYDELTKNMPNLFISLDREFTITSFNTACEKFTGYLASSVFGKSVREVFPVQVPFTDDDCMQVITSQKARNFTASFKHNDHLYTQYH